MHRATREERGRGTPLDCIGSKKVNRDLSSSMTWTSLTNSLVAWYGSAAVIKAGMLRSCTLNLRIKYSRALKAGGRVKKAHK